MTLAPGILLWVHRRLGSPPAAASILAVVAGWMTSPYALHWPSVFAHNFGSHALTRYPSPITEMRPGFVAMVQPPLGPLLLLAACMLAVPWIVAQTRQSSRERLVAAAYWVVGAIAFGYAVRLFVCPRGVVDRLLRGSAPAWVTRDSDEAAPRLQIRLIGLFACLLTIIAYGARTREQRQLEGSTTDRMLPAFGARPAEQIAQWLRSNTLPDAHGRIMTSFAFAAIRPGAFRGIPHRWTVADCSPTR